MYPNCEVKLSKTLIWVSGDTFPVKDQLKADGFRWSAKKRAWWKARDDVAASAPSAGQDYTIMGAAADGSEVVIAECHHERLSD